MPTEPTVKRMKLPSFLKRGDVWLRLCVEMKRDRAYHNYKAVARLESVIYEILDDNERYPIWEQMDTKTFSARGGNYDKICNAVAHAISHLQQFAASQGVWLPLSASYMDFLDWNNLDHYFRSMFKDAEVIILEDKKNCARLTAECRGVRRHPKLLSYPERRESGRYVYYLGPNCAKELIRYDNAELLSAISAHNKSKPKQKPSK